MNSKRFVRIVFPFIFMLVAISALTGCKAEKSYLVTVNNPLEWAGRARVGTFYMIQDLASILAKSDEVINVSIYFGPEAIDMAGEGVFEGMKLPPPLVKATNCKNMAEWAQLLNNDFGVTFYASKEAVGMHKLTPAKFFTPISIAEYAEILIKTDKIIRF
jgi:hypothetical protein